MNNCLHCIEFDKKVGHCIYSNSDIPTIIYDCEHFEAWPLWMRDPVTQSLVSSMLIETTFKQVVIT